MAIKKCKECGIGVSSDAKVCPHCGKRYPTGRFTWPVKIFLVFILLVALGKFVGHSNHSSESTINEDKWGIVTHFGMITTVWISQESIKDTSLVAQILHVIERNYGRGIVWFFDDRQHTPMGVPMTDNQMLHWVGSYDPFQSDVFSYIEVTDGNTSPPQVKFIKTTIRPGYVE